jgi:hypothetical protein
MTRKEPPAESDTDSIAEQIAKLVTIRDRADKAAASLKRRKAAEIRRPGLNAEGVARAVALIAEVRRAEALLPAAEELVRQLRTTRLDRGHQLILLSGEIASDARRGELAPTGEEILAYLAELFDDPA